MFLDGSLRVGSAPTGSVRRRRILRLLRSAWRRLVDGHERARQRRQLRELDDRLLRDIGVTRAAVDREVRKPFWQP